MSRRFQIDIGGNNENKQTIQSQLLHKDSFSLSSLLLLVAFQQRN
jgi:hypothetical protein